MNNNYENEYYENQKDSVGYTELQKRIKLLEDLIGQYKGKENNLLNNIGHLESILKARTCDFLTINKKLHQEIIERKKTEDALRESEDRSKIQFKSMPIPTYIWQRKDKDFILIDYNDASLAITDGLIPSYLRIEASRLFNDTPDIIEQMNKCFKERGIIQKEIYYKFKSLNKAGWFTTTFAYVPPDLILVHTEDITERKKIEKELKESEKRFRHIADFLPFAISIIDSDGKFLYINLKFKELFGYSKEEIKTETNWLDLAFPEQEYQKTAITKLHSMTTTESDLQQNDFKVTCKDGTLKDIVFRPIHFENSKKFILYEDITERKRTEKELKKNEQWFEGLVTSVTDYMSIIDEHFNIIWANNLRKRLFGENIVGKKCYQVYHRRDKKCDTCLVQQTFYDGKIHESEKELFLPDGKRMFLWSVSNVAARYEDGRPKAVVELSRDITERKMAIKALEDSEKRYRTLFNGIPVGLYRCSPEGEILDANTAMLKILNYPCYEAILRTNIFDLFINTDHKNQLKMLLEKNGIVNNFEIHIKRYNETPIWLSNNIRAIKDKTGKIIDLEGAIEDISKRKEAEEAKTKIESHLQQAQKMEALGTLASGIAHDFNNILSYILKNSELALEDIPNKNKARPKIEETINACNNAKEIIKQILTFSRKLKSETKPVDLCQIIKSSLKLIRASIPSTITIQEQIYMDSAIIMADQGQMQQMILNLCSNAYQSMKQKGGILTIKLDYLQKSPEKQIELIQINEFNNQDKYIHLTISDSGYGIKNEDIQRIFDPFYTTKPPGEGTGLGLSIVHGIVKSHGGLINVTSEVDKGTTFDIYLPYLAPTDKNKVKEKKQKSKASLKGNEHILLIDDEKNLLFVVKEALERFGYKVTAFENSIEALELFKQSPETFDIIITDNSLPGISGERLITEILRIAPQTPIILLTGQSIIFTKEKAEKLGVKGYLEKPILAKDIVNEIRRILDQTA